MAGRMRVRRLDEGALCARTLTPTLGPRRASGRRPSLDGLWERGISPREHDMKTLKVGEITITSLIERDGPWRRPEDMFPAYDPEIGRRRLAELDPIVFDPGSGRMVITYQTFLVRTPRHTIL